MTGLPAAVAISLVCKFCCGAACPECLLPPLPTTSTILPCLYSIPAIWSFVRQNGSLCTCTRPAPLARGYGQMFFCWPLVQSEPGEAAKDCGRTTLGKACLLYQPSGGEDNEPIQLLGLLMFIICYYCQSLIILLLLVSPEFDYSLLLGILVTISFLRWIF